jgi:hypothetical protein
MKIPTLMLAQFLFGSTDEQHESESSTDSHDEKEDRDKESDKKDDKKDDKEEGPIETVLKLLNVKGEDYNVDKRYITIFGRTPGQNTAALLPFMLSAMGVAGPALMAARALVPAYETTIAGFIDKVHQKVDPLYEVKRKLLSKLGVDDPLIPPDMVDVAVSRLSRFAGFVTTDVPGLAVIDGPILSDAAVKAWRKEKLHKQMAKAYSEALEIAAKDVMSRLNATYSFKPMIDPDYVVNSILLSIAYYETPSARTPIVSGQISSYEKSVNSFEVNYVPLKSPVKVTVNKKDYTFKEIPLKVVTGPNSVQCLPVPKPLLDAFNAAVTEAKLHPKFYTMESTISSKKVQDKFNKAYNGVAASFGWPTLDVMDTIANSGALTEMIKKNFDQSSFDKLLSKQLNDKSWLSLAVEIDNDWVNSNLPSIFKSKDTPLDNVIAALIDSAQPIIYSVTEAEPSIEARLKRGQEIAEYIAAIALFSGYASRQTKLSASSPDLVINLFKNILNQGTPHFTDIKKDDLKWTSVIAYKIVSAMSILLQLSSSKY